MMCFHLCVSCIVLLALQVTSAVIMRVKDDSPKCSEKCDNCSNVIVKCSSQTLSSVPLQIPVNVQRLILSHNLIDGNRNLVFPNDNMIKVLYLDSNKIQSLSSRILCTNLGKLEELYLMRNYIKCVENNTFKFSSSLRKLDLSDNRIQYLDEGTFFYADHLAMLNVSHNAIHSVSEFTFDGLKELMSLDLSHNPIKSLEEFTFWSLVNLRELILSNTSMAYLNEHLVVRNNKLTRLDVSLNMIDTFGRNLVKNLIKLPVLTHLDASNNPLVCDCHLLLFYQLIRDRQRINQNKTSQLYCAKPSKLSGRTLLELRTSDLLCNEPVAMKQRFIYIQVTTPKVIPRATNGPLVYDPIIGWKTCGVLSGLLLLCILRFGLDHLKSWCFGLYHYRHDRKMMKLKRAQQTKQLLSREYQAQATEHRITLRINREGVVTCESDNHSCGDHSNVFDNIQYEITGRRTDSGATDDLSVNTLPKNLNSGDLPAYDKVGEKKILHPQGVQGKEDKFGLHVLEMHPDCPVHNPSAQKRLRDLLAQRTDRTF